MKQRDRQERELAASKVDVLNEALPWIHRMAGKTFVIKYGGSAMEDPELCRQVVADIEMLKLLGIRIVLVHGASCSCTAGARPSARTSRRSACPCSSRTACA